MVAYQPPAAPRSVALGWGLSAAVLIWMLGTCVELVRLTCRRRAARRLFSGARMAPDPVQRAVSHASRVVGLARCPTVRLSPHVWSPGVIGLWKSGIVLPLEARSWSAEDLELSLIHEASHVRRGDPAICFGAWILRAVFWPNPLVWMAERKLSAERERACDDAALLSGQNPIRYAEHLVQVALSGRSLLGRAPMLGFAGSTSLLDRVTRILRPVDSRSPLGVHGAVII